MLRAWRVSSLALAGFMIAGQMSGANASIRVDESTTRLLIQPDRMQVLLAVNNSLTRRVESRVRLELINELNRVTARTQIDSVLEPGLNTISADLLGSPPKTPRYMLWNRLRYHITTSSHSRGAIDEISGTISLSEICPDIFALTLIKPLVGSPGARYRVRVLAQHPVSKRSAEGVDVQAELSFDGLPSPLTQSRTTDAEGYAVFDFEIPLGAKGEGNLKVSGERNGLSVDEKGGVAIDRAIRISLNTDKSIYQPGQILHARVLMLDPSRRAVAGAELTLKILDPDDSVVHRASLRTSRFGIASDDWAIPANTRLGDYELRIDQDEDDEQDVYTPRYKVRISRYELPNFSVSVKPDRSFYLPGQNAEVEVRGDYLFGQPVTRARVRVVHETEREWNYREQKWEIREEEKYEGELDQSGRFVATLDLAKHHSELAERDYSRMEDLSYAAYITDVSTNRTEQRRFDLRVTKEPIHIYVIEDGIPARNAPLNFFVSTFRADGTPVACRVDISQVALDDQGNRDAQLRPLRTVTTNRYGVARAGGMVISEGKQSRAHRYWDAQLELTARDRQGHIGHSLKSLWYASTDWVRVDTNKALYKKGEPIDVKVTATGQPSRVFFHVAQGSKTVHSESVSLVKSSARLTLPFKPEFKDEMTIAAYCYTKSGEFIVGRRTVLFPQIHELTVETRMSRPQYRPGEEAEVEFQIQNGDGSHAESALGVSVIDRAVEERARTESDFGGRHDFARAFYRLWGYEDEIAGVTLKSLNRLDPSRPLPPDLQLVAEILLLRRGWYWPEGRGASIGDPKDEFGHILAAQFKPVKNALDSRYARTKEYPLNAAMLTGTLADFGLDVVEMRDPWGLRYITRFSIQRDRDFLAFISPGPDKRSGTHDDFTVAEMSWPYFRSTGEKISRAVQQYYDRTEKFIRDRESLKRELLGEGINIDTLQDRWGRPYRCEFGVSGNYFTIQLKSGGSDRRLETNKRFGADDFSVWTSKIDYFARTRAKIEAALANHFRETNSFPKDDAGFKEALERGSIDTEKLRDPWGNRYYATFKSESGFRDQVRIISWAEHLSETRLRTEITPITQTIAFIYLRSAGMDGTEGTPDDFDAASYSRIISEQGAKDATPQPATTPTTLVGATGAITGIVVDPNGAIISGASVKATNARSATVYEAKTNDAGQYILGNLPAGLYEVNFRSPGFMTTVITEVPVSSSNVTLVHVTLRIGATTETVEVTAGEQTIVQTQSVTLSAEKVQTATNPVNIRQNIKTSTPRLREYFPETLVWRPSIETDSTGRARLNFKLADNITTWKMSVIASTLDGEIGTAKKEILAFQPFFMEHDPPPVLTEGDEIALPVVLRNYLDKPQMVDIEMKPAPWFEFASPSRKRTAIAAGDSSSEVFRFRAAASIEGAKQRVSASAADASDAIEKSVTVHPDGQEISETATEVFSESASITINVPATAIRGSAKAELKIYPNLLAHLVESIEGIMRRPYGCAEQTISSAYPSLMLLRYFKSKGDQSSTLAQKARRHVEAAYERLLNYQGEEGGISYWDNGEAHPALTAYAIRFLNDARDLISVEQDVIRKSRTWLLKHQLPDGSWPVRFPTDEGRLRTASLTAFIARVLASTSTGTDDDGPDSMPALRRSLNLLAQRIDEIDEPYLIASYALAASSFGDRAGAARAREKLRLLAHDEGYTSYWKLETNTPFYGWGIAGRIEATAIAVQALASLEEADGGSTGGSGQSIRSREELVNRGLLFLLRQKDRYGVWCSTQATVNTLDALMSVLVKRQTVDLSVNSPAEIFVNDIRRTTIQMPPETRLSEPITTDVSPFLIVGNNRIEIRRAARSPQASAQVIESHYQPWPAISDAARRDSASEGALRFQVRFDKTEAKINEEITCRVHAARVGFRGYGMLLAEIGLPPGTDVDRASLERAVKETGWGVYQYDVLPDRVILYLWPQAGGTRFEFKLKPRFGIVAKSAPSMVYDYYNPEARAIVPPVKFVVR